LLESQTSTAPTSRDRDATAASKPRRSRARTLTTVDRRTRLGLRIEELRRIFVAALGGLEAISPAKRIKVNDAIELKALAEKARGDWMRDGGGSLDDVIRAERKADAAVRALGIVDKPKPAQTLQQYLAEAADARRRAEAGAGLDSP
jgi:hypothetical protein